MGESFRGGSKAARNLSNADEGVKREYFRFALDSGARKRKSLLYINSAMAIVVFIRGVNVGGHRTFRPSILAGELSDYGVVNVGAAGTIAISACAFGTTLQILVNVYRKVSTRSNFSGYATY
jgi:hypothetical protein